MTIYKKLKKNWMGSDDNRLHGNFMVDGVEEGDSKIREDQDGNFIVDGVGEGNPNIREYWDGNFMVDGVGEGNPKIREDLYGNYHKTDSSIPKSEMGQTMHHQKAG
jgi:hypothetical protein